MSALATPGPLVKAPPAKRRLIWLQRTVLGVLAMLVALAGFGATYQAVATELDERAYPAPGQLIDVGGYKLHIHCMGQGSPTIILDHVGAGNSAQWGVVQPEIAKRTRVCAYDRAGFGWSEAGPAPRDAQHNARELHALLSNAQIPGPYVLVGHSFGANVARLYLAAHPDKVVGMVLIDPGHLFDTPGVPTDVNARWQAEDQFIMRAGPWLSRLGLMRLAAALGGVPDHGDLPVRQGAAFDALNLTTKFWDTLAAQNAAMPATSAQVLHAPHDYGALPLVVLSATEPDDKSRRVWSKVNAEVATFSSNSSYRVVVGATHMGLAYAREQAQPAIAAISQVVEAARTQRPLRPQGNR